MSLLSFQEALALSPEQKKRSVLLGNGFSIACRPHIFRYDAIFDSFIEQLADQDAERVAKVFDRCNTRDFEKVLRLLTDCGAVAELYGGDRDMVERLRADVQLVRNALADALSRNHPEGPFEISSREFECCASFLRNFECVYSLNYDLLLYWTVMHAGLCFPDGFREPETPDAPYVEWGLGDEVGARMRFLHGALHLFAAGACVRKVSWCRTGRTLKDQILEQLRDGNFPVFVAEGTAEQKLTAINRSGYLSRSYRSLQSKGGDLFVFGCSLGESDDHIVSAMARSPRKRFFVGMYGDPSTEANLALRSRCAAIRSQREYNGGDVEIHFFDTATVRIWK